MKACLAASLVLWCCALLQPEAREVLSLGSPDRHVEIRLLDGKTLQFAVNFRGHDFIRTSPLNFSVDNAELTSGATVAEEKRYYIDETYPWHGVLSRATNRCNGGTAGQFCIIHAEI